MSWADTKRRQGRGLRAFIMRSVRVEAYDLYDMCFLIAPAEDRTGEHEGGLQVSIARLMLELTYLARPWCESGQMRVRVRVR